MEGLKTYLEKAVNDEASDVFFGVGGPVHEKKDGHIVAISEDMLFPQDAKQIIDEIYELAHRSQDTFIATGDDDFSFAVPGLARFRVNTLKQRGSVAAVIRIVAFDIPDYQKLRIPEEVMNVSQLSNGLVIVTGLAGSGKSSTLACVVDKINKTRDVHIITLEDPIEFLHRNDKSIVTQREISIDTADYLSALRACLRQAPDVIQLGEMRDRETISTAMTAAETGHLLLATLHTNGAANTIDRIIDSFPSQQQDQIRVQLSMVLDTVICQKLLPDTNGGMVPAYEIMHVTPAIKNLIRDNKNHQIDNAIASGKNDGMISMDQYIFNLYQEGIISKETAIIYADNEEQMRRRLG